jgi:hypothetical protein
MGSSAEPDRCNDDHAGKKLLQCALLFWSGGKSEIARVLRFSIPPVLVALATLHSQRDRLAYSGLSLTVFHPRRMIFSHAGIRRVQCFLRRTEL